MEFRKAVSAVQFSLRFLFLFVHMRGLCGFLGYSLVEVRRLLIAVASLIAACGIFPDQGTNLCLLHGQVDSILWSHREAFSLHL